MTVKIPSVHQLEPVMTYRVGSTPKSKLAELLRASISGYQLKGDPMFGRSPGVDDCYNFCVNEVKHWAGLPKFKYHNPILVTRGENYVQVSVHRQNGDKDYDLLMFKKL